MYIKHKQTSGQRYSQNDLMFNTEGMMKVADMKIDTKDMNQVQNTSSYEMIYIQIRLFFKF